MKPLKISEINAYINKVLKMDFLLNQLTVVGELTNVNLYPSGHLYMSLKDEHAQLGAIMYQDKVSDLNFKPENGMMVEVKGEIRLYEQGGRIQLVAREMKVQGQGDLFETYLKRKENFEKLGYFNAVKKRELPTYPEKIGIVTSLQGAALQDVLHVLNRRNPSLEVLIAPASVQGVYSSEELIQAFKGLDDREDVDLILLTRGGGSLEDLWSFNDEGLIECLHHRKHPIVSAVGHETDTTLIDFIADLRAPTPSAAAEVITRDRNDLIQNLDQSLMALSSSVERALGDYRQELRMSKKSLNQLKNREYLKLRKLELEALSKQMKAQILLDLDHAKYDLDRYDFRHLLGLVGHRLTKDQLQLTHSMSSIDSKLHRELHRGHQWLQRSYEVFEDFKKHALTHEITDENGSLIWTYDELTRGKKFYVNFEKGRVEAEVIDREERHL